MLTREDVERLYPGAEMLLFQYRLSDQSWGLELCARDEATTAVLQRREFRCQAAMAACLRHWQAHYGVSRVEMGDKANWKEE